MKKAEISDLLYWKNSLAKVIGRADRPTLIIEMIDDKKCPHCRGSLGREQFSIIPESPLFQENAEPVNTIK